MNVWIGCDHGGYETKLELLRVLDEMKTSYTDVGCHSTDIVRYPYYAAKVAGAVADGRVDRGVLICTTGIGMSMIANKYKGVRAALCLTEHMARMTREHNDSNVLCIGGRITELPVVKDILRTWLATDFIGGRHEISLSLIAEAEEQMYNGTVWGEAEENYR